MKRVPLKNSSSNLKSTSKLKSKFTKIKSKKVENWKLLRQEIYATLAAQGIVSCELNGRLGQCSGNLFPSLAHSLKRRYIKTDEEMREVIFCCVPEHEILEAMKPEDMYKLVRATIAERQI